MSREQYSRRLRLLPFVLLLAAGIASSSGVAAAADDYVEAPPADGGLPSVKPGMEEYESRVPPPHMRCDTCCAAAFWIHRALKLRHKDNFLKKLKEVDVIETIEDVCLPKTFSRSYGIKRIDNRHRLSGGGLKWFYTQAPAVGTAMPGQWMNHECRDIQGELGEDDLYDLFWKTHVLQKGKAKGDEAPSDVPFFKEVCIKRMKHCTKKEAFESYDGYEEKHMRDEL